MRQLGTYLRRVWSRQSEAIRGDQRQSEAIRGHQRRSEAIRGDQRPSEAIRGDQRRSEAIRGDQRQSEEIRGDQRQSEAIRGNQRQSEAIRPHQRQLGAIEPSSRGNQEAIKTLTRRHRAVIKRQSGGHQDTYSAPSSRSVRFRRQSMPAVAPMSIPQPWAMRSV